MGRTTYFTYRIMEKRISIKRNSRGALHSTNEPSVIDSFGNKFWFVDGVLHNLDGPAIQWTGNIRSNTYNEVSGCYYINGISYTKEEWKKEVFNFRLRNLKKL